jgi:hypothetical protein
LQEDRNARASWLTTAYIGGGISSHVYHQELGLALPVADFYLRGMTQDAIPAADPLGLRQQPRITVLPPTAKALPATTSDDEEDDDGDEERAIVVVREYRAGIRTHGPAEFRASVAVINRRTVERIADLAVAWIRSFFGGQGGRVVEANGALVDWAAEERALGSTLERLYQVAGDTAYGQIQEQYGVTGLSFDLANPNLADVRQLLAQRVTGINAESRRVIASVVSDALGEGVTVDELADRLQERFASWSDSRAETIARTESQVAFNSASVHGYRESGVVDRVMLHDNESHTEDYGASDGLSCAARNGLVVPLEQAQRHINAEHPRGTLAVSGVLTGEEV